MLRGSWLFFVIITCLTITGAYEFEPLTDSEIDSILNQYDDNLQKRKDRYYEKVLDPRPEASAPQRGYGSYGSRPSNTPKAKKRRISDSLYGDNSENSIVIYKVLASELDNTEPVAKTETPQWKFCPQCQRKFSGQFSFCPYCSVKLTSNTNEEEDLSKMQFVFLPPGTYTMGSPQNEPGRYSNESLSHRVTISKGFYISKTEITQKQWAQVMGYYESEWRGDNLPVQRVSWNQIQEFIQKLNDTQNQYTYRLPTEAEWEYAARAGTNTLWSFGNEKSMLDVYGWCESSAGQKPHEVGTKKPNPWGLYDMHGNVWEWVSDWYKKAPAPVDATDPQGPQSGNQKTYRGGGFGCTRCCRSAARYGIEPDFGVNDIGFRLVRE